jgi:hypothetical protein
VPGRPYERDAYCVFTLTRSFSYEEHVTRHVPFTDYDLAPCIVELAGHAPLPLVDMLL